MTSIESRLAAIPDFLHEGAIALRLPVPLWTKLAEQSCKESVKQQSKFGRMEKNSSSYLLA
jgi:hypothetical protein